MMISTRNSAMSGPSVAGLGAWPVGPTRWGVSSARADEEATKKLPQPAQVKELLDDRPASREPVCVDLGGEGVWSATSLPGRRKQGRQRVAHSKEAVRL